MPPYSTLRDFINAISTGNTNITRVLERVTNDPAKRKANIEHVSEPGAFDGHIPEWICTEFRQAGMKQAEVDHINERWPDAQKEIVRSQLYEAWFNNRPIHFSWELHDGEDPRTEVRRDSNQDVRVIFRSPRKGVRLKGLLRAGDVQVEV